MSKKPWEDKVSEEESEEVVDADFLDDEDEFEDDDDVGGVWDVKGEGSHVTRFSIFRGNILTDYTLLFL